MTSKPSGPAAGHAAGDPDSDVPKTETTLTTRIRINIPGSRPIPPVVVRKPVGEGDGGAGAPEAKAAPAAAPAPAPASPRALSPGGESAPAAEQGPAASEGSNWFAPRKTAPGAAAPAAPAAPAGPAAPAAPRPGLPTRPGGPGVGTAPRGTGPGAPAGPAGPGSGAPGGRTGAPAGRIGGPAPAPAGFAGPGNAPGQGPGQAGSPLPNRFPAGGPGAPAPAPAPGGPAVPGPGATPAHGVPAAQGPFTPPGPGGSGVPGGGFTPGAFPAPGAPGPGGPTGGPAFGGMPVAGPPAGDDPAAPRWPGPEVGNGTLPRVDSPAAVAAASMPRPAPVPVFDDPVPSRRPTTVTAAPAGKPAKKGRSKLVLAVGGILVLLGVAYGAGLLLNHSDVPKGTTVLGVDISGSREEAVAKMQTAFGNRASSPLQLTVGGKQAELKPEKAGLSLDSQTTVRNAAGSDYNPITVIGSLIGQERPATPVIPVDEEKLLVALQELAGSSGSATEGTIKFEPNKVTAVPGKTGASLDVDASLAKVTDAYRAQVKTGKAVPVELPVTDRAPTVTQAELDRAMNEFAKPAMSANVTVKAGGKSIPFGPAKSLPKILSMTVVEGKLVEKYDLEALKELYGNTFDGVLITRGNGEKTAVTPQDVAGALGKALRGKTAAERVGVIETDPS
ncbi:peptidoglycan binding domain-containing protein [Streptomyces sp. NPDC048603]|uniref:peptidoglycan binding domain-containing protein n=1 Tax=Streptomyces sp. NPDC048603 TaxID=3365577 RepID=UPI003719BE3D